VGLTIGVAEAGDRAVRVLALLIIGPTIIGLVLSALGKGTGRVIGLLSCFATGFCYITLAVSSAISMGASTARHPMRFLIPAGYVGWVHIKYRQSGNPTLEIENGVYVCRFPKSGTLATSSPLEQGWAKDEYLYYSDSGHLDRLRETGWGAGGMVWGGEVRRSTGSNGAEEVEQRIYIGNEEQYRRDEAHAAY
jgi:hypothetical protein